MGRHITENTKAYYKRYQQTMIERINVNLHKEHDKDVYNAIMEAGEGNKQAGVKKIVREWLEYKYRVAKARDKDINI